MGDQAGAARPGAADLEVGVGEPGMGAGRDDVQTGGAQPPVELEDEHGVGQLGLVVGAPGPVAVLGLQVVEVDAFGRLVPVAADGDHPAAGPPGQGGQEPAGQREMAEVVGAELPLVALGGGLPVRDGHHAGVVDQQVQALAAGQEPGGEALDAGEVGQVDLGQLRLASRRLGTEPLQRRRPAAAVPGGQQHPGALAGQLQHRLIAQARVTAGDQDRLARLVGNVVCRPSGHLLLLGVPRGRGGATIIAP